MNGIGLLRHVRANVGGRRIGVVAALALLVASVVVGASWGAEPSAGGGLLPPRHALVAKRARTRPGRAEGRSLTELGRSQAVAIFDGVFGPELRQSAVGLEGFDPLAFHGDHVAVVSGGSKVGAAPKALLDATFPLKVEDAEGEMAPVDLDLGAQGSALAPTNSPVEVSIPTSLSDAIEFPEIGLSVELAADRDPRPAVTGNLAFYPNAGANEDVAVAASPTGVETYTEVRAPGGPVAQTLKFDLPKGASMRLDEAESALIERGGSVIATVSPANAVDADGEAVPVTASLHSDELTLEARPTADSVYPILLDPLVQSYSWYYPNSRAGIESGRGNDLALQSLEAEGWVPEIVKSPSGFSNFSIQNHYPGTRFYPEEDVQRESSGLNVMAGGDVNVGRPGGGVYTPQETVGAHGSWIYTVPRYFSDQISYGEHPESFISRLTLTQLRFDGSTNEPGLSPYLEAGIRTPAGVWLSALSMPSQQGDDLDNMPYEYKFPEVGPSANPEGKIASVGLWYTEADSTFGANVFVGAATVELSEPETSVPKLGVPLGAPGGWHNTDRIPLAVTASSKGLGVAGIRLSSHGETWTTRYGCSGVDSDPCPHTWSTTTTGAPQVYLDPAKLVTGVQAVSVAAEDPLGHLSSAGSVEVKIDHTEPTLELQGTLLEQGLVGKERGQYSLAIASEDGSVNLPQSGVAAVRIEVDHKVVREEHPGCATQNCKLAFSWNLKSAEFSEGQHTVKVTTEDAVGNVAARLWTISLVHTAPTITLTGTATEQAALGDSRPTYGLGVKARTTAKASSLPVKGATFGTSGSGTLAAPRGAARGPNGEIWVTDGNRVLEYGASGEFIRAITAGYIYPLKEPSAIAIGGGYVWVDNTGWGMIVKYNLSGTPQGSIAPPHKSEGLTFDSNGNLWVADMAEDDLYREAGPDGPALTVGKGAIAGQLTDIAASPEGTIWAAVAGGGLIEFGLDGTVIQRVGEWGEGVGKLETPRALAVTSAGTVWAVDGGNSDRVSGWDRNGSFAGSFAGGESMEFAGGHDGIVAVPNGDLITFSTRKHAATFWHPGPTTAEIGVKVSVDGTRTAERHLNCGVESSCSAELSTAVSQSAGPGQHAVVVEATDVLGNTAKKELNVDIQPDKTKPTLETSGQLVNSPGGWVVQEGYPLMAHATDDGYGVSELFFDIDGSRVAGTSQSCEAGGCALTLNRSIDTAEISGGAHDAELVAVDGAGNRTAKQWTLNVDPSGNVTAAEVAATVEASDATSESAVMAPNSDLVDAEGEGVPVIGNGITHLENSGTPDVTSIAKDPEEGFAIGLPESTVEVTPVTTAGSAGTASVAAEQSVAVTANTGAGVDTVMRPVFNGVMNFESIREGSSPHEFSWEIALWSGQSLKQIDSKNAEIVYESGLVALTISAEVAHDAVGTEVPTSLTVTAPDTITLNVETGKGNFVYPVVAGSAWQGGTTTEYIAHPLDRLEIEERERQREHEEIQREEELRTAKWEQEVREFEEGKGPAYEQERSPYGPGVTFGKTFAPEPVAPVPAEEGTASGSALKHATYVQRFNFNRCAYDGPGGCVPWDLTTWGQFKFNGAAAWWPANGPFPHCEESAHGASVSLKFCNFVGHEFEAYGAGYHITSQTVWNLTPGPLPGGFEEWMMVYMYGSGHAEAHDTHNLCNPLKVCET